MAAATASVPRAVFNYVEYGIAQLGAMQMWLKAKQDPRQALAHYRAALKLGGTRPLPDLFSAAGLKFDFTPRTIDPLIRAGARRPAEARMTPAGRTAGAITPSPGIPGEGGGERVFFYRPPDKGNSMQALSLTLSRVTGKRGTRRLCPYDFAGFD